MWQVLLCLLLIVMNEGLGVVNASPSSETVSAVSIRRRYISMRSERQTLERRIARIKATTRRPDRRRQRLHGCETGSPGFISRMLLGSEDTDNGVFLLSTRAFKKTRQII